MRSIFRNVQLLNVRKRRSPAIVAHIGDLRQRSGIVAVVVASLGPGAARARFRLRVKELPHEAGAIAVADAVVLVDWYGPESMVRGAQSFRLPAAGEGWQLNGRMREVSLRAGAPRVTFKVRGKSPSTHRHPAMDASGLAMKLWELRGYAERILSLGMADRREQTGLVKAMTLGLRSDVPREVMDVFKGSGTVHVFSISGLHVAIVSSILVAGLSALPLRLARQWWWTLLLPVCSALLPPVCFRLRWFSPGR